MMLNELRSGAGVFVESRRIEICGGIASGKTTLAKLLPRLAVSVILEDFAANPFWRVFYKDPVGAAFETEISFLLQHYHAIKAANRVENVFVCDFSLNLDSIYADVTLRGNKRGAFQAVFEEVRKDLAVPALLIYLRCDAHVELERIIQRGREAEKSITLAYLNSIGSALEELVEQRQMEDVGARVLVIDSHSKNFADREDDKSAVLDEIRKTLDGPTRLRCEEVAV